MEEVAGDPTRIYNCDETCIQLCPSTGKVIGIAGWKNIYEVAPGPEKTNLTFLGTSAADGSIVTPMIIYPYIRLPRDIALSVPENFYMATSESGWMRSEIFYEYLANAFNPCLEENNIQKPVFLFLDGHKTHLTMQASKFCEDSNIVLYLLPPNTTHMLQPADVGAFKPLKDHWRHEVIEFQRKNPNSMAWRRDVAPLLAKVMEKIPKNAITNGFRATGLYPLDPNQVDYSKCLEIQREDEDGNITEVGELLDYQAALCVVDKLMGEEVANKCKNGTCSLEDFKKMYATLRTMASQQNKNTPTLLLDE